MSFLFQLQLYTKFIEKKNKKKVLSRWIDRRDVLDLNRLCLTYMRCTLFVTPFRIMHFKSLSFSRNSRTGLGMRVAAEVAAGIRSVWGSHIIRGNDNGNWPSAMASISCRRRRCSTGRHTMFNPMTRYWEWWWRIPGHPGPTASNCDEATLQKSSISTARRLPITTGENIATT